MSITMKIRQPASRFLVVCLVSLQTALPCLVLAQGGPAVEQAAPVGLVNSVSGTVYARNGSGEEVLLKAGDVFGPGTTFRSGADGNVVLLFADGQNVALSKDSVFRVDDYRFDPRDPKGSKASFNLASGVMTFVTGAIHTANPQGLRMSIGETSIGLTSKDVTAFIVEADPKSLGIGYIAVTIGEISVNTKTGAAAQVSADQFVRLQPGQAPSSPAPLAAAPAVFQAEVAASQAIVLGSNNSIDVQSTALEVALSELPATGAGAQVQNQQAQASESAVAAFIPAVTPGGGRGCVGSPC